MPLPQDSKTIYIPQSSAEIRDGFLTDLRLALIQSGVNENPATQPGSDYFIIATGFANAVLGLYANIELSANDQSELTASGAALDAIRDALGLVEVGAAPSSGLVLPDILGLASVLFSDGAELVYPNGKKGHVDGTQVVAPGGSVLVLSTDTGADTNQAAGTKVRFSSPPLNVNAEAEVDIDGLTGGVDAEDDERKRERILNHRRNIPGGGNWPMLVELAEGATGSVLKGFAFPCLGGPGSVKLVIMKAIVADGTIDLSRELGASTLSIVENAVLAEMPQPSELVVQSVADQDVDIAITLELQQGNWIDDTPWPTLNLDTRVFVLTVTDTTHVTLSALTTTAPIAGTSIAWWDTTGGQFVTSKVVSSTGGAGAWALTLDRPLVNGANSVAIGDYISAAPQKLTEYRSTWLEQMNKLGPGENRTLTSLLPSNQLRLARHPLVNSSWLASLTSRQVSELIGAHDEIVDATYSFRSATTPTVPGSIDTAPNVLKLRKLAFYPIT